MVKWLEMKDFSDASDKINDLRMILSVLITLHIRRKYIDIHLTGFFLYGFYIKDEC